MNDLMLSRVALAFKLRCSFIFYFAGQCDQHHPIGQGTWTSVLRGMAATRDGVAIIFQDIFTSVNRH